MNLLIQQSLTVEQRLQKAVSDIMMNDASTFALAGLLAVGAIGVSEGMISLRLAPTDATKSYGRAFCDGLNDAELRFLVSLRNYPIKLARHLHISMHHL